jgi:hypothetical protein
MAVPLANFNDGSLEEGEPAFYTGRLPATKPVQGHFCAAQKMACVGTGGGLIAQQLTCLTPSLISHQRERAAGAGTSAQSIENATIAPLTTNLDLAVSRSGDNREADISTEQAGAQAPPRVPRPHGHQGWP